MVVAGVVIISFSAIWVRLSGESPVTVAFFRAAYALPALAFIGLVTRKEVSRTARQRTMAFTAGIVLAVDFALWHVAIELIGAGLATVLGSIHVIIMMIVGWLLLHQRPTPIAIAAAPVALSGVFLISGLGSDVAQGEDPVLGAIVGATTAFLYVTYLLLLRQSSGVVDATSIGPLTEATAGAAVGALLMIPLDSGFTFVPTWPAHGWLAALALGSQVLAWLLIAYALPRLEAWQTSMMLVLQPGGTVLWAYLIFDERFALSQWIGLVLVIGAVTAAAMPRPPNPTPDHDITLAPFGTAAATHPRRA
jgi:drug/metabolite transporter (DMT)-like permease